MGNQDLSDMYALALGPAAIGLGHIYQANPSCPCYNYYLMWLTSIQGTVHSAATLLCK